MTVPASAAVVVVGGGVIGTSIAFHLAEAGVDGVVLVERDAIGSGSTSRAAGGVRTQFSDELNVLIGLRSLRALERFAERPGGDVGLHQVGYLFALTRPDDVAAFEEGVALQNRLGVPSRLVEPEEVARLSPLTVVDDVIAGAFCPLDGYATPDAVTQGYATAARALGVTILTGCSLEEIEVEDGEIAAAVTSLGRVATRCLVCAAGPWSRHVGGLAGVELPVEPLRRQILFTGPIDDLPPDFPFTIDFATGFYFHREGPGLLMGVNYPEEPGYKLDYTEDWLPVLTEVAERRAPSVLAAGIRGGWAGLYEVTPDHNALVGEAPEVSRFLYATGFSGHGFMQGPAIGEIVRDLYLGRQPFVDVRPLAATRFAAGESRPERNVI
jgi:sarcosine oxidase subunit beta